MVTNVKNLPIKFDPDRVEAFCRDRGIVIAHIWGEEGASHQIWIK
jgi:hypothetical protein